VDGESGAVVHTETDDRPSVVKTGVDQVELITALWSVLVEPEVACLGMNTEPLSITVAVCPNLREDIGSADKRVVAGDSAVVVKPDGRAVVV